MKAHPPDDPTHTKSQDLNPPVTTTWLDDLNDDELQARLTQRGVPPTAAAEWIQWRESTFAEMIERILGDDQ